MIISHKHRFIFFAVPKTGTHAVRQALRTHLAEDDLEQVGLFVQKRFPFQELSDLKHGHISVEQIRPVIGDATFKAYHKFAVVRNPYDRFVSYCAFVSRGTNQFSSDPQGFMRHVLKRPPMGHLLFRPQYEFLVDAQGRLAMDYVARNECMQLGYDTVVEALKLPTTALERVNTSSHRPFEDYYDAKLSSAVSAIYRQDFEMFGYDYF